MSEGFVYALVNPAMPGLVKIGKTTRGPEERAVELSSATGVATPFILVYYDRFEDCDAAEMHVHRQLQGLGMRHAANREFFRVTPREAIHAILGAPGNAGTLVSSPGAPASDDASDLDNLNLDNARPLTPAEEKFAEGTDIYYHANPDGYTKKGVKIIKEAADEGCAEAAVWFGDYYAQHNDSASAQATAIEYIKRGIRLGCIPGWAKLGKIFDQAEAKAQAETCWDKFFTSLADGTWGEWENIDPCDDIFRYAKFRYDNNQTISEKNLSVIKSEFKSYNVPYNIYTYSKEEDDDFLIWLGIPVEEPTSVEGAEG